MSSLYKYSLHLADNALILGHRNSEWTGHGPILEQDIALSNIALDLVGQARNFYQLAAAIAGGNITEDDLAYMRGSTEYLNCLLVEQENGHWGTTVLRQFLFSVYSYALYDALQRCKETRLAAVAEKSLKEVTYHRRWSSEWVIRLGQGTEESNIRMQDALDQLWKYTKELYTPEDFETDFVGNFKPLAVAFEEVTSDVLSRAALKVPEKVTMKAGGKRGRHSDCLVKVLDEMQYMQRTYPGMQW